MVERKLLTVTRRRAFGNHVEIRLWVVVTGWYQSALIDGLTLRGPRALYPSDDWPKEAVWRSY